MRKAKGRVVSLRESDEDEEDELLGDSHGLELEDGDEGEEGEDEEELDELDPSASIQRRSRTRGQKTSPPVTYELRRTRTVPDLSTPKATRGKLRRTRTQVSGTPSDGDDEETDGEDHGSESDKGEEETGDDVESVQMEVELEPKRLRNGKIVGEEEEAEEESVEEDDEGEEDGEGEDESASVDLEVESNASLSEASEMSTEEDEEPAAEEGGEEFDDDLQDETEKTLVRRRRDHLVKLCENRGIEAEGTKPQLVEALLQWVSRACLLRQPNPNQYNCSATIMQIPQPPPQERPHGHHPPRAQHDAVAATRRRPF